jgi:parallel beta-helix repeat protein
MGLVRVATGSKCGIYRYVGRSLGYLPQSVDTKRLHCTRFALQIDGNRGSEAILPGGANLELGGPNVDQLIEHVHSRDPRGWSCLHVAEGPFTCSNVTIRYNDIGPCGSDAFQQWADGISLSCANSEVYGNVITDSTDGGIVVFGSPGSRISNNTISATDRVMLGGINMVDYLPWDGNYTALIIADNRINGGFADVYGNDTMGGKTTNAVVKIGTAIGPRTWFGDRYGRT